MFLKNIHSITSFDTKAANFLSHKISSELPNTQMRQKISLLKKNNNNQKTDEIKPNKLKQQTHFHAH